MRAVPASAGCVRRGLRPMTPSPPLDGAQPARRLPPRGRAGEQAEAVPQVLRALPAPARRQARRLLAPRGCAGQRASEGCRHEGCAGQRAPEGGGYDCRAGERAPEGGRHEGCAGQRASEGGGHDCGAGQRAPEGCRHEGCAGQRASEGCRHEGFAGQRASEGCRHQGCRWRSGHQRRQRRPKGYGHGEDHGRPQGDRNTGRVPRRRSPRPLAPRSDPLGMSRVRRARQSPAQPEELSGPAQR